MGIVAWIIFGALAGWVASLIAGTNRRQGCLADIIVGVVGAFIGGFLMEFFRGEGFAMDFNLRSFVVAVAGSVLLLLLVKLLRRR